MRHPCNLCSLQFATEEILERHVASFHIKPDANRVQPILPVVLEKIKIEPELIRLDEDEDDDHQSTGAVQKQPPKAIFEKLGIPQIVKRLRPKGFYKCEVCSETFSLLRYFRKHLITSEEQGFSKCQEYYKTNIINRYVPVYNKPCMQGVDTAKDSQTIVKEQSFSRQRTTDVGVETCEPSNGCYQCNICQQEFSTRLQLTRHKVTAHQQNPFECDLCQKKYRSKHSLTFHKLNAHEKFRFKCDLCNKDFSTKEYLKQHKRGAHDGIRHKCKFCLKEFDQLKNLNQHTRIRHSDIRHRCDLCPKTFALMGQLTKHKLIAHVGVRQKCKLCLKEFTDTSSLKIHILNVHEGVRHKCKICLKEFTQMGNFKIHILTVHDADGVRHKCKSCSKSFSRLERLNRHKLTVHNGFCNTVYAKRMSLHPDIRNSTN